MKYPRPMDQPNGETCRFCGEENDWWDEDGFFYLNPDKNPDKPRAACFACFFGEPGKKHKARFGCRTRYELRHRALNHLCERGLTYFQHMERALGFSWFCLVSAAKVFLHSFYPGCCRDISGEMSRELERLNG